MLNCVSDAAPAHLQRRLLAAMADAESQGLLVRNGLQAFTACGGKVAQHALLRRHGLKCPRSRVVSEAGGTKAMEYCMILHVILCVKSIWMHFDSINRWELLVDRCSELPWT